MTTLAIANRGRQVGWLVGLMVVLAGVVWYQFLRPAEPAPAASNLAGRRGTDAPGVPSALPTPQVVRLESLDVVGELSEGPRNPFVFGTRIVTPPPGASGSTAGRGTMPAMPMPALPTTPLLPPGPPPITLRLSGLTVLSDTGRVMVTLKDPQSGALYQAFEGDIVDGRYRVVKVGSQSVVLSYVDGTGTRTIGMGG